METVDLVLHYEGKWEHTPEVAYHGGEAEIIYELDIDCLSFTHIMKKYSQELGVEVGGKLYVLNPGSKLYEGLCSITNDNDIRKLVECIKKTGVKEVHIYVHYESEDEDRGVSGLGNNLGTQCSYIQPPENFQPIFLEHLRK
jgi:hypothetical protein